MRILIVVHGYPPTFTGGAELRAERTARGLVARHHDVAVLSIKSLAAAETRLVSSEQLQDGVLVHHIHVQPMVELGIGHQNPTNQFVHIALDQLIREWRPDIIHLFSGYLMGIGVIDTAASHKVPVIVSLTDYWWLCHRINLVRTDGTRCDGPSSVGCARCHSESFRRFRLTSNAVRPLADGLWYLAEHVPALGAKLGVRTQTERLQVMLAAIEKADALIAPSRVLAERYIRYGIDRARIHVWRQGVNLTSCPLRKPSSILRFGYFGQIKHHKGVHTLLEAWEDLNNSRPRSLTIYGSDHGEETYGARMYELTRHVGGVDWRRAIAHAEIWQALAEIDVLVIPSRWYENSPNVILEAQAMGVTVIGSDLGGIAELVHHGRNGLLFAPDDPASLATQMRRLLDEPELLAELRRNLIPFHSFSDELDQIERLYEQLAAQAAANQAIDHARPAGQPYAAPDQRATQLDIG